MRVSFFTDAQRALFLEGYVEGLWKAAEEAGIPDTVNAMHVFREWRESPRNIRGFAS